MANLPELHLVQNRCGGTSLVYEGRAYKLKRAARKKYWRCSQDKKGCGGAASVPSPLSASNSTNSELTVVSESQV
ncbi:hypothetical protein T07_6213 [Trichinella nelsoni]|uniref:FLYWCH-type domain-containing protein n=1 Tax=Trichinella nelsoni TaxID=6336 RepID=A0A0V0SIC2_9BILA|nr:hypothetical protein T07_6213 [Trichinella nelsoni]